MITNATVVAAVAEWSPAEVVGWLRSEDLETFAPIVDRMQLTGPQLLLLNTPSVKLLGEDRSCRRKLLTAVAKLKKADQKRAKAAQRKTGRLGNIVAACGLKKKKDGGASHAVEGPSTDGHEAHDFDPHEEDQPPPVPPRPSQMGGDRDGRPALPPRSTPHIGAPKGGGSPRLRGAASHHMLPVPPPELLAHTAAVDARDSPPPPTQGLDRGSDDTDAHVDSEDDGTFYEDIEREDDHSYDRPVASATARMFPAVYATPEDHQGVTRASKRPTPPAAPTSELYTTPESHQDGRSGRSRLESDGGTDSETESYEYPTKPATPATVAVAAPSKVAAQACELYSVPEQTITTNVGDAPAEIAVPACELYSVPEQTITTNAVVAPACELYSVPEQTEKAPARDSASTYTERRQGVPDELNALCGGLHAEQRVPDITDQQVLSNKLRVALAGLHGESTDCDCTSHDDVEVDVGYLTVGTSDAGEANAEEDECEWSDTDDEVEAVKRVPEITAKQVLSNKLRKALARLHETSTDCDVRCHDEVDVDVDDVYVTIGAGDSDSDSNEGECEWSDTDYEECEEGAGGADAGTAGTAVASPSRKRQPPAVAAKPAWMKKRKSRKQYRGGQQAVDQEGRGQGFAQRTKRKQSVRRGRPADGAAWATVTTEKVTNELDAPRRRKRSLPRPPSTKSEESQSLPHIQTEGRGSTGSSRSQTPTGTVKRRSLPRTPPHVSGVAALSSPAASRDDVAAAGGAAIPPPLTAAERDKLVRETRRVAARKRAEAKRAKLEMRVAASPAAVVSSRNRLDQADWSHATELGTNNRAAVGHDYRVIAPPLQKTVAPPAVGQDYRVLSPATSQASTTRGSLRPAPFAIGHDYSAVPPTGHGSHQIAHGNDYRLDDETLHTPQDSDYAVALAAVSAPSWHRERYFRGFYTRDVAATLLRQDGRHGCFMVRCSLNAPEPVLSFLHNDEVRHSRIRVNGDGLFYMGDASSFVFKTVEDLIASHYCANGTLTCIINQPSNLCRK